MVQNTSFFSPIYFGIDALESCDKWLQERNGDFSKIFILVDENTQQFCLPKFLGNIPAISDYELLEIPFGEESKSIDIAHQLWQVLMELGADRKSLLINLGGGVVSDLGGFVAGTYMRGIEYPLLYWPKWMLRQEGRRG
jgi:3-dehydroquinate synthase